MIIMQHSPFRKDIISGKNAESAGTDDLPVPAQEQSGSIITLPVDIQISK